MLAIHHRLLDRMKNVKAITAGAVAFGVGLTAAAAYVGATMVYDNFSYDFADQKANSKVAGASTEAEIKAENGQPGIPGNSANSNTPTSSTAISGQSAAGTSTTSGSTAASGGAVGSTPIVGGRGAGATPTPTAPTVTTPSTPTSPVAVPSDPETCPCGLLNTVDDNVDVVVDGLGL